MSTSVGTYATTANVKTRLSQAGMAFGTNDDTVIGNICNQVNGWIESKTGRILAPYGLINTTVSSGGGAGSTAVTLASATGISTGDALLFGPVSGTHEHGVVVSVSGNVVTLQWALVATYAGGTAVVRCQLFDGFDALESGRLIQIPNGIVYATNLEVAFFTGGTYNLIPATDWFLRPLPLDREPGWPATELWMTDIPSSGNQAPIFTRGIGNIRLSGVQPGWPAQPDEIVGLAEKLAVAVYRARGSGGAGTVTMGTDGERTIERAMDTQDWITIRRYSSRQVQVI